MFVCLFVPWDHPRVRGEHALGGGRGGVPEGPSPRARGAPAPSVRGSGMRGTIPACAGSTARAPTPPLAPRDHPRVRGEHAWCAQRPGGAPGPSPRARGARLRAPAARPDGGTIPACAGSTHLGDALLQHVGDHPRVRGEHVEALIEEGADVGPSPRARGAPWIRCTSRCRWRTIPACAGSTEAVCRRLPPVRDHPRVRGEHRADDEADRRCQGPSPRARGAHLADLSGQLPGTIPACAGSTLADLRFNSTRGSKSSTFFDSDISGACGFWNLVLAARRHLARLVMFFRSGGVWRLCSNLSGVVLPGRLAFVWGVGGGLGLHGRWGAICGPRFRR